MRHDPRLSTDLTRLLGIDLPILQAPMAGGWVTPELVIAVSESGGMGSLPAARTTAEQLDEAIHTVRAATGRPFGVNFLMAGPEPARGDIEAVQRVLDEIRRDLGLPPGPRSLDLPPSETGAQFEVALARRVACVSFAMGCPAPMIERARDAGARALVMVTSVQEALEAEVAGADAVIAQGIEAGGHRSTFRVGDEPLPEVGTFVLVPKVVDAVGVPVVAAGGVMDGRGLAAALVLGAGGVQLGTRFLLARESAVYPAYRRLLQEGDERSTRVTTLMTGRPARAFANRISRALESHGVAPLPWPYQAAAAQDLFMDAIRNGRSDTMALLAGQGIGGASAVEMGAAEIVEALVTGALERLDHLNRGTPK